MLARRRRAEGTGRIGGMGGTEAGRGRATETAGGGGGGGEREGTVEESLAGGGMEERRGADAEGVRGRER